MKNLREGKSMNFYDVPPLLVTDPAQNATDILLERVRLAPQHEIFARQRQDGEWYGVSTQEFYEEVVALAKGLIAAGVTPGQAIGILSRTRYEWVLIDFAIWFAGAVSVPIYESSAPAQIEWILSDSDSVALFVENDEHLERFNSIRGSTPRLNQVWRIDSPDFGNLIRGGEKVSDADLQAARSQAELQDLATIIYTSGTTGNPKGCELTHRGFVDHCRNAVAELPEFANDRQTSLLFLPMAHVFARFVSVICIHAGIKVGHLSDPKTVAPELAKFKPTFLLAVPRVFEKVYNAAELRAESTGKGKIFRAAAETAINYSRALDTPSGPGFGLKLRYRLFDKLVFGKLRAAMGGRVEFAIAGGAPLGERLGHFFRGLGLVVLEGYGLTETSAAAVIGRAKWQKIGKVGRALPGTGIKIADDGEIWLRGINIMRGYWRNEAATREAFVEDWFRTGDIGTLDEDGFLTVTGRKKEMIITAGGKNVAPALLEDPLRAHPLIGQALVIGDAKPFVGALISLDPEMVPVWGANNGIEADLTLAEAVEHPLILAELQRVVDAVNATVSQAERIRKFAVLDKELTEASGHLTPSMKIKRARVMADFADSVDKVYS
jgi:long-chain acyl-CoA synthetase